MATLKENYISEKIRPSNSPLVQENGVHNYFFVYHCLPFI